MFTNVDKSAIIMLPNKFNSRISGIFLYGVIIPFFVIIIFRIWQKRKFLLNDYGRDTLILFKFVWRQLECAFFGALTSVGALFVFLLITNKKGE